MHWYGDMGWGGWVAMIASMALLWGLLIVAVVVLVRAPGSGERRQAPSDPLRMLDERFARGEIDEGEYLSHKRALTTDPEPSNRRGHGEN